MIELYAIFCLATALTLFITVQLPIFVAEKPEDAPMLGVITFWLTTAGVSVVCAPLMFAFIFHPTSMQKSLEMQLEILVNINGL